MICHEGQWCGHAGDLLDLDPFFPPGLHAMSPKSARGGADRHRETVGEARNSDSVQPPTTPVSSGMSFGGEYAKWAFTDGAEFVGRGEVWQHLLPPRGDREDHLAAAGRARGRVRRSRVFPAVVAVKNQGAQLGQLPCSAGNFNAGSTKAAERPSHGHHGSAGLAALGKGFAHDCPRERRRGSPGRGVQRGNQDRVPTAAAPCRRPRGKAAGSGPAWRTAALPARDNPARRSPAGAGRLRQLTRQFSPAFGAQPPADVLLEVAEIEGGLFGDCELFEPPVFFAKSSERNCRTKEDGCRCRWSCSARRRNGRAAAPASRRGGLVGGRPQNACSSTAADRPARPAR